MRWHAPSEGDKRIVRRFLLFPFRSEASEMVWLEWVTIEQAFECCSEGCGWANKRIVVEEAERIAK